MKKLVLLFVSFVLVFAFAACSPTDKEEADTTSPVITMVTALETTFDEGDTEPVWGTYFTIVDNVDGTMYVVNSMLNEDVDMNTPGEYTVTLTVADEAGNEATEAITITVNEVAVIPTGDLIAIYEGVAPLGMTEAGTFVTINFYDTMTFDLWTASLRGSGPYEINDGVISLSYTQEHPDGGDWVLTGTITTTDVTDPTTVMVIDPIEYFINMGGGRVMDVGTTTFEFVNGCKAEIAVVEGIQKTFTVGDEEPDWTTYFTITDEIDGEIPVTSDMIMDGVDLTVVGEGMGVIKVTVLNSSGNTTTTTIMIFINAPVLTAKYEGTAPLGMTEAGTFVTVNFYDNMTFDLWTSSLRGSGPYEITDGVISLSYTEEHPDGGDWVLTGTINTTDITDPTTVMVIDPVEYSINMGSGPIVMDVGTTTFALVIGSVAEITKVEGTQTSFMVGDEEPDWTTYFTISDAIDGDITVTPEMITDNVDLSVAGSGMGTITINVVNSSGNASTTTIMIFIDAPVLLYAYTAISESEEPMMAGAVVKVFLYDNNTFEIYANDTLRGAGSFVLVGQAMTFTYEEPMYDFEGTLLPTIEATIDTETLVAETIITTTSTNVYISMGPTFGVLADYGVITLKREALFTYEAVSETVEEATNGINVQINLFDGNTFNIYTDDELKGVGTYVLVDQTITFTYVTPMYDFDGVTLLPTIVGTIDTTVLEEATVLSTTVTNIYLPMGPMFGMVVDYGVFDFATPIEE